MPLPPEPFVRAAALAELAHPSNSDTRQFFGTHPLVMEEGQPLVQAIIPSEDVYGVYFKPEDERYFLVMIVEHCEDGWHVRGCRAEAGTKVALTLSSDELTAKAITQAIGLQPTDSWSRGEARTHPRQQHRKPYTFTRWSLCPDGELPGEIHHKLTRLLDLTEGAAARIQALKSRCHTNIVVAYWGYSEQMWGIPIEAHDLARIAALGVGLDIDLYASGPRLGSVELGQSKDDT